MQGSAWKREALASWSTTWQQCALVRPAGGMPFFAALTPDLGQ